MGQVTDGMGLDKADNSTHTAHHITGRDTTV